MLSDSSLTNEPKSIILLRVIIDIARFWDGGIAARRSLFFRVSFVSSPQHPERPAPTPVAPD